MDWSYNQRGRIEFGCGKRFKVMEYASAMKLSKCVLVCDAFLRSSGAADELVNAWGGSVAGIFSDIRPNPTTDNVNACAKLIRETGADYVVAMGGGSSIDCAKAAAAIAKSGEEIENFHGTGKSLPKDILPIIALPTTAGTGSEVTSVSVLTNVSRGFKAPLGAPELAPVLAVVDPELTYTVPPFVTASTGLDVLSHAIEGYFSINHQPICDANALYASRLVFKYLPDAVKDGADKTAREMMCVASLTAGLAFALPKTGPSHACSFVLTNRYHIPHGEACALTLDSFVKIIAKGDQGRLDDFAAQLGFKNADMLADAIYALKKSVGLRVDIQDLALNAEQLDALVKDSHHPNMLNSPVEITDDMLYAMYKSMM